MIGFYQENKKPKNSFAVWEDCTLTDVEVQDVAADQPVPMFLEQAVVNEKDQMVNFPLTPRVSRGHEMWHSQKPLGTQYTSTKRGRTKYHFVVPHCLCIAYSFFWVCHVVLRKYCISYEIQG